MGIGGKLRKSRTVFRFCMEPSFAVLFAILVVGVILSAQPIAAQTTLGLFGTDEDLKIYYDRLEADISTDNGGRSLVVLGNVLLEGRGFSLRADAVGVYVEGVDQEKGPINPRVLALGGVLLDRSGQTFQAESVFYEVESRRMVLSDARIRLTTDLLEMLRRLPRDDPRRARSIAESWVGGVSDVADTELPVASIGIASRLLVVEDFAGVTGEEMIFTTDLFDDPEWALVADRGRATPREEVNQLANEDKPGGFFFAVDGARLELGGLPVAYFPSTRWDSRWGRSFPLRDLRISDSTRFGSRIDTSWNGDFLLPERFEDEIDLTPRVDSLSSRGTGYGLDFEWGRDPLRWADDPDGRLDLYGYGSFWQISDEATEDSDGTPVTEEDRYRGRAFVQARLTPTTLIDAEWSSASDANFVDEFFRVEARTVKRPENFFSIRQELGESTVSSLRVDSGYENFTDQVERSPELALRLLDSPLIAGFRADADVVLSDLELVPGESSATVAEEVRRLDLRSEFSRPFIASRWLNVIPTAGVRYTQWTSPNLAEEERSFLSAGLEAATRFSRVFQVRNQSLGIDGLRHVVDLRANYSGLMENTLDSAPAPFAFDEIDGLDNREVVTLSMGHRFQTRQSRSDRERIYRLGTRSIAEARIDALYYPDADRDNSGEAWGDLFSEVVVHGSGGWSIFGESRHDLGLGQNRGKNLGLRWLQVEQGLFEVSWRDRPEYQESLLAGGRFVASSRWDLGLYVEYDLDDEEIIGQWWEVGRNFRTFRLGFAFDVDAGINDDTTFRVDIGLREWLGGLGSRGAGRGFRGSNSRW
ncbi:MAG: hypothetical protein CBC13_01960 [Planctomycetia bacterium TMED53]|nr:MAG: hypothetical protein CBC13_01960 [Planctomycetia bacterium TMED53]